MKFITLSLVAFAFASCQGRVYNTGNEIIQETPRIKSGDELLSAIVNDCFSAESTTECLKVKVLTYLDSVLGFGEESGRAFASENIDKVIFDRVGRILNKNEFKLTLPESYFQGAEISYRADKGLDIDIPEKPEDDAETSEARGLLKKKLLLPVLLLLKLKMKALMPIFVALIGIKALKALVLSKIAIVLVVGFIVMQLLKKGGMPMPMMMTPAPEPPVPATAYGPAAPSNAYGPAAPSASASTPSDSYSPQWEPSSSGPYARVWDTSSSHGLAYNAYYPGNSGSSSSSSSYSSPSTSSSSSSVTSSTSS